MASEYLVNNPHLSVRNFWNFRSYTSI